jgi:hypothetical protein
LVSADFKSADPVVASVLALHIAAASRDGITFDGLLVERRTLSSPVFQCAGFCGAESRDGEATDQKVA